MKLSYAATLCLNSIIQTRNLQIKENPVKVENLTIQRVNVTLSCGCGVACDFKDPLCKDPFKPDVVLPTDPPGGPAAMKEFSICKKHKDDSQRSMLEFMMAERMDEGHRGCPEASTSCCACHRHSSQARRAGRGECEQGSYHNGGRPQAPASAGRKNLDQVARSPGQGGSGGHSCGEGN